MNHNPNAQNRRSNTERRTVNNDGVIYGSNLRAPSAKKRPLTASERTKVITVVLSAILSALIFMPRNQR